MSCGSRPRVWSLAVSMLLVTARGAAAQGWHETQLWAVALASRPAIFGGGLGFASRDAGRTRVGFALAGGVAEGTRAAGRAELAWHFLLDPAKRKGLSVYGGGGAAVSLIQSSRVKPYLLLAVGVESAPATPTSWFLEGGFGGGARIAMGLRFRTKRKTQTP